MQKWNRESLKQCLIELADLGLRDIDFDSIPFENFCQRLCLSRVMTKLLQEHFGWCFVSRRDCKDELDCDLSLLNYSDL